MGTKSDLDLPSNGRKTHRVAGRGYPLSSLDMVKCFLTGAALSCHIAVVGDAFLGGAKPLRLDIYHGVDRLGT
jgi:hypothetical protein